MCLTERELEIIGRLASLYNVLVIEDLAYLNMDFRDAERGMPYEPPYQPTVGKYTNNCLHMISCSKMFSYAGQRAAIMAINPYLAHRKFPSLASRYENDGEFLRNLIYNVLYSLSSGVTHSVQFAMAAMFKAACQGKIDFVTTTREYARRAKLVKEIMLRNGFHIVYDYDVTQPVGDGFFFTIGYKGMTGGELLRELLYYGVSSISLSTTGSEQQGVRACTSRMREELYDVMQERMKAFREDHPQKQ